MNGRPNDPLQAVAVTVSLFCFATRANAERLGLSLPAVAHELHNEHPARRAWDCFRVGPIAPPPPVLFQHQMRSQ